MSISDDKRAAVAGVNAEMHQVYRDKLAEETEKEARGRLYAHDWIVSMNGVLAALESSGGTFLHSAPVVVHSQDLATAPRVVIRIGEPSLALREEEVAQFRLPIRTGEEVKRKQALSEEMTGRKLADVLSTSAALGAELGKDFAIVTAPSPTTHDMPQGYADAGEIERGKNSGRHIEAIRSVLELTVEKPLITLMFDNPDPRIAEQILKLLAENPEVRDAVDEVVVVDGEPVETSRAKGSVVALPADPLQRFRPGDVSLNRKLNPYGSMPQAALRPLIEVPESMPVRCVATDSLGRVGSIATALRTAPSPRVTPPPPPPPAPAPAVVVPPRPTAATSPPSQTTSPPQPIPAVPPPPAPAPQAPAQGPPLSPGLHQFLAELQNDRSKYHESSDYVVTGVVALRLHAHAAGVAVPESFSQQGYPAIELALAPGADNLRKGFAALHTFVEWNWVRPHPQDPDPLPTGAPPSGQTASILQLRPEEEDVPPLTMMVSYGTTGPDDYPQNPVEPDNRTVIDGVDVPVARMFEAAAATQRMIQRQFPSGQVSAKGQALLADMTRLVQAINQVHDSRPAPVRGRMPARPPGPPASGPPTPPGSPYPGGSRPGPGMH